MDNQLKNTSNCNSRSLYLSVSLFIYLSLFCSPLSLHFSLHSPPLSLSKTLLNSPFCTTEEENEFHILFVCPIYEDLRLNTIPSNFMSKRNKNALSILIASKSISVAKFFTYVFSRRKELLER